MRFPNDDNTVGGERVAGLGEDVVGKVGNQIEIHHLSCKVREFCPETSIGEESNRLTTFNDYALRLFPL